MPKKRWMAKNDMLRWGLSDEKVDDRIRWQFLIKLGALENRHPSWTADENGEKLMSDTYSGILLWLVTTHTKRGDFKQD